MADPTNLSDQQFLSQDPEVLGLQRQRQLANLLTGQAFNAPQGQMISGHYVKPSALQQALPMINAAIGGMTNANLDTKQQEMADMLRQRKGEALSKFSTLMSDPSTRAEAMKFAAKSPDLQNLASELMKPRDVAEGGKVVIPGLGGEGIEIAKGNPKYRAPIHVDVGNAIELRDPLDPTKVIQRLPKGVSPGEAARLTDEGIPFGGGNMPQALRGQPPAQTINPGSPVLAKPPISLAPNAPAYAQGAVTMPAQPTQPTAKQPTFETPQPPAGLSPKQNREWFTKASEPLVGEPAKKVSGAINYQQSLDNYKNLISNFSVADMANPQKRALLSEAYNTVTLTGKEAFNLGVLNGGDERILSGLQPNFNNPSTLLVTQKTAQQIANNQKNYAANVINNEYKVHQKIVPQNLRQFVTMTEEEATTPKAPPVNPAYRPPVVEKGQWGIIKVVPGSTQ